MDPLDYFAFFKYVPTVPEYLRYSRYKRVPKDYQIVEGRVVSSRTKKYLAGTLKRQAISLGKLEKREGILNLLARLPMVKYLGVSGTVSMLNAKEGDDIDLFVITRANCLFTTRLLFIFITSLFGVRRTRGESQVMDKLCLNLFFSEADLKVPKHKQSPYVAHEIGQLWTIVNKEYTYQRFLWANRWINNHFRNFIIKPQKRSIILLKPCWLERPLRTLQLWLINRHRTTEIVTDTQLWFFPEDFELKLTQFRQRGLQNK